MAFGLTQRFGRIAASVGAVELIAAAAGVPAYISAPMAIAEVARASLGYVSPYSLGNYRTVDADATDNYARNGNLPMTSMARLGTRRGGGAGESGSRDLGAQGYLSQFVSPEQEGRDPGIIVPGGAGAILQGKSTLGRFIAPGQEQRQIGAEYDYGVLRQQIDTLSSQYRDYGGLDKPSDPNAGLPLQTIRDNEGRVLMQGHAQSAEALIAQKLSEADKATDPAKKVVNLAGANLDGLNFKGFNFTNVDMRGASMKGCEVENCKFENVDAEGIDLRGTKIRGSHFENVNLNRFAGDKDTKFSYVSMANVHMVGAEAPGVKFEHIRAENLNIAGADFKGSEWTDVQAHNLWARGVHMEGAKLGNFHVAGPDTNFDGAHLTGAKVHNASFGTPGNGISMRGLQAEGSEWTDTQFNNSDLSGANFSNAWFKRGVDMRNVVTPHGPINMDGATLTGLKAGPQCKIQATTLVYGEGADQVVMRTKNGMPMVFNGTDDIEKLHKTARSNNLSSIRISDDGVALDPNTGQELAEQIRAPGLVQARKPKPSLMNDPFAGGPKFSKTDRM